MQVGVEASVGIGTRVETLESRSTRPKVGGFRTDLPQQIIRESF